MNKNSGTSSYAGVCFYHAFQEVQKPKSRQQLIALYTNSAEFYQQAAATQENSSKRPDALKLSSL